MDWKRFLKSRQSEFKKLVNSPFLGFEVDEVLMYRVMPSHLKNNTYFKFFLLKIFAPKYFLSVNLLMAWNPKDSTLFLMTIRFENSVSIFLSQRFIFPYQKSFGYYGYMLMINTQGHIFT